MCVEEIVSGVRVEEIVSGVSKGGRVCVCGGDCEWGE